ncbi:hypothetical protein [Halorubrum sp. DTA46]|uniref:hypothetical protein n=1 Tax=Halorubrum sp. DTA46 TaxID=3402162 RepID=UPI003AB09F09
MTAGSSVPERIRAIADAARTHAPLAVETDGDEPHLTAAVRWLLRSNDTVDGRGSAATYNLLLGWEPPYPETTGYIIPSLYAYADGVGSGSDLGKTAHERASVMADWLETVQLPCGAFPGGTGEDGVLSYHHGDPREYRGGPAGFWEYMHGADTAGTIVQTLTDELDAGIVQSYRDVDLSGCETWGDIRRELYTGSVEQLAEAVERVRDEANEPTVIEDLGPMYHPPDARELLAYGRTRFR